MKKYIAFVLIVLLFATLFVFDIGVVYATSGSSVSQISRTELDDFLARAGNNRTAYTNYEKIAANYLASKMTTNGLEYYSGESYIIEFGTTSRNSQNVVGVKRSETPTDLNIVIGAHYDNTYGIGSNNIEKFSNGVSDNASGVLCVLSLMTLLQSVELNYNIIYVFFGAEEDNMVGSQVFVSSISMLDIDNILLMINFDQVGAGDFNYFYVNEGYSAHASLFANDLNIELATSRASFLTDLSLHVYSNPAMFSDCITFIDKGVRTISFFSGNLKTSGSSFVESANYDNLAHSSKDTATEVLSRYPEFFDNLNNFTDLVFVVLCDTNIISDLNSMSTEINFCFLNNKYIIGIVLVMVVLFLDALINKIYLPKQDYISCN